MTLLDTNILIHYLKGLESVVSRLQKASPREVAVPSVVAYEIEYGTLKTRSPAGGRWFQSCWPDSLRFRLITKRHGRRHASASSWKPKV